MKNGEQLLTPRKPGWRVVLGSTARSGDTYERPEGDDLQVVGDHLAPLTTQEIAKALSKAPGQSNLQHSRDTPPWLVVSKESPAPVVIVKKRRVAVMPQATSSTTNRPPDYWAECQV